MLMKIFPRERGMMEIPEAYSNPEEKALAIAESALVQIMGDVVATTQKWIELSNAVRAGEITDVKVLEDKYSQFLLMSALLSAEILESKYGGRVTAEAQRSMEIRNNIFDL
jgi:hypothetical protein